MDVEECFTSIDHCTDGLSDEFRMLKAMNHKMTSDDCKQSCLDQNDVGTQIKRDGQLPEIVNLFFANSQIRNSKFKHKQVYCQAIFYNPPSTCKLYYEVKNAKSAKKQQLRTTGKSNECSQMKIGCGQNESSKKRLSTEIFNLSY